MASGLRLASGPSRASGLRFGSPAPRVFRCVELASTLYRKHIPSWKLLDPAPMPATRGVMAAHRQTRNACAWSMCPRARTACDGVFVASPNPGELAEQSSAQRSARSLSGARRVMVRWHRRELDPEHPLRAPESICNATPDAQEQLVNKLEEYQRPRRQPWRHCAPFATRVASRGWLRGAQSLGTQRGCKWPFEPARGT